MKFTTILAGAMLAFGVSANTVTVHDKVYVTLYETVTKHSVTKATVTETKTKTDKIKVTVTAYKTKTKKVCSASASPTMSVLPRSNMKARTFGDAPLYAKEFA